MKRIAAVTTLGTILLSANSSFAWFEICNTKADGASMYVTYAYYEPNTTKVYTDACGSYEGTYSPAYYNTWQNTGWWYLTKNQCAYVYGPALNNTWAYVYAQISDGSSLNGANTPFTVANTAFTLDQYTSGPFNCGSECVGVIGTGDCINQPSYWSVQTLPINQGSNQNFKLNIY